MKSYSSTIGIEAALTLAVLRVRLLAHFADEMIDKAFGDLPLKSRPAKIFETIRELNQIGEKDESTDIDAVVVSVDG